MNIIEIKYLIVALIGIDIVFFLFFIVLIKRLNSLKRDRNFEKETRIFESLIKDADNMAGQFPEREMVRFCSLRCRHMNQITLEDTLEALVKGQYKVELDQEIIEHGREPIDHMLAIR